MGASVAFLAFLKMASVSSRFPWTSVTLGDAAASFFAPGEVVSLVTARILKSAFLARRDVMTLPPCLPVAPVISSARDMSVCLESGWIVGDQACDVEERMEARVKTMGSNERCRRAVALILYTLAFFFSCHAHRGD